MSHSSLPTLEHAAPLLFAGGMGYDSDRNGVVMKHFGMLGHTVIAPLADPDASTVDPRYRVVGAHGSKLMSRPFAYLETTDPELRAITSLQQEARANEVIGHIEASGTGPIHYVAQSADAQNAILAAYQRPDLFRSLVLAYPSGMVKKNHRTEYLRQALHAKRDPSPKQPTALDNDFEFDTRPQTVRQKLACGAMRRSGGYMVASSAIAAYGNGLLHDLRERDDAPAVGLVLGTRDVMMRPERIIESLIDAHDVDTIVVTGTKHGMNGRKDVAAEVSAMIKSFETDPPTSQNAISLADKMAFTADVPLSDQESLLALARSVPRSV